MKIVEFQLLFFILLVSTHTQLPNQYWVQTTYQMLSFLSQDVSKISILSGDKLYLERLPQNGNTREITIFNAKNLSDILFSFSESLEVKVPSKATDSSLAVLQNNGSQLFFQDYRNFQTKFAFLGPFLKTDGFLYELEMYDLDYTMRIRYLNLQTGVSGFIQQKLPNTNLDFYPPLFEDINFQYFALFIENQVFFFDKKTLSLYQKLKLEAYLYGFTNIIKIELEDEIIIVAKDDKQYQNIVYYSSSTNKFSLDSMRQYDKTNSLTFLNHQLEGRSLKGGKLYKWGNFINFMVNSQFLDPNIFYRKDILGSFHSELFFVLMSSFWESTKIEYYEFNSKKLSVVFSFDISLPNSTVLRKSKKATIISSDKYIILQAEVTLQNYIKPVICIVDNQKKVSYNIEDEFDPNLTCFTFGVVSKSSIVALCNIYKANLIQSQLRLIDIETLDIIDKQLVTTKSTSDSTILGNEGGSFLLINKISEFSTEDTFQTILYKVEGDKILNTEVTIPRSNYQKCITCSKYMVSVQSISMQQLSVNIYQLQALKTLKRFSYLKRGNESVEIHCDKNLLKIYSPDKVEVLNLKQEIKNWSISLFFYRDLYGVAPKFLSFDQSKLLYMYSYNPSSFFYNLSNIPIRNLVAMTNEQRDYECEVYQPNWQAYNQNPSLSGFALFIDSINSQIIKFKDSDLSQQTTSHPLYPPDNLSYYECIKIAKSDTTYFAVLYKAKNYSTIYYIVQVRPYIQTDKMVWFFKSSERILDINFQQDEKIVVFFQNRFKTYYLHQVIIAKTFSVSQIQHFDIQKNCSIFAGPSKSNNFVTRIVLQFQRQNHYSVDILYKFQSLVMDSQCSSFALKRKNHFEIWRIKQSSLSKIYQEDLSPQTVIQSIKFAGKTKLALELDLPSQILIKDFSINFQTNYQKYQSSSKVKFQINKDGLYLAETVDPLSVSVLQLQTQTQVNRFKFNAAVTGVSFSPDNNSLFLSTTESLYVYKTQVCKQFSLRKNLTCSCMQGYTDQSEICVCLGYISQEKVCKECSSLCKSCQGPGLNCLDFSALFYILVVGGSGFIIVVIILIVILQRRKRKQKKQKADSENEDSLTQSVLTEKENNRK